MIAVAFLCSLMIGFSRLRGARAHRPFINLSHQHPSLSKRNNRSQETKKYWLELNESIKYLPINITPQHPNYDTMLPPV